MPEETFVNLKNKLFELFLALMQCVSSVEELLQTPGLFQEGVSAQQAHWEVGSPASQRVGHCTAPWGNGGRGSESQRCFTSCSSFLFTPQTLALELQQLFLTLSDRKEDLLKATTWLGLNSTQFHESFEKLHDYLVETQAAAASRSQALKTVLDFRHSFQVGLRPALPPSQ